MNNDVTNEQLLEIAHHIPKITTLLFIIDEIPLNSIQ